MAISPDGIIGNAVETVGSQMAILNNVAGQYRSQLSAALSQIAGIKPDAPPDPPELLVPEMPAPENPLAAPPDYQPGQLDLGTEPKDINIDAMLAGLELGDLGELPQAPEIMPIFIPEAPGMANIQPPERPTIDTSVAIPDAPVLEMPSMEALEQIRLPEFAFPELPTFDATPPTVAGMTSPRAFINWQPAEYASETLDDLAAQVRRMMAGGTGLPAAVEDALFSRARERESAETERAVQEATDTFASRGFAMPPGMLAKQAAVLREQGRLKAAALNRDILAQATQMEIENIRFAIQQGMALEQLTQNLFENTAKRLFEAARFQAEAEISVFNAQVGLFNAQNAAFQTLATVYRTKLDGALSKLTAYKTAIEGQVALGQINQQKVEVFKARLAAVESSVEVYKATMQGASVRADAIKNQFDAYRADVQAFAERIGAEKAKFDAYESRIKGEAAKAGIMETQARAYASTIQAVANKAEVRVKAAQITLEAARAKVSAFLGNVDAYKARTQAELANVQAATSRFQGMVDAWRADAGARSANAELKSKFADMTARTNIAYAEMEVGQYNAKLQHSIQSAQIALESAKAMGQYTAQLAAGAMSAAHVSASISGSGSANSSASFSESKSTSYNYSY